MKRSYLAAGGAVLLLLLAGGWFYFSPLWTLKAMHDAAKANDAETFAQYVDYPALREDLREEATAYLEEEAKRDGSEGAQLGLAMGRALMGPLVDTMVSPERMRLTFAALAVTQKVKGEGSPRPEPKIERLGLNRFRVSTEDKSKTGFVFERRGLGWKLAGIDLGGDSPLEAKP